MLVVIATCRFHFLLCLWVKTLSLTSCANGLFCGLSCDIFQWIFIIYFLWLSSFLFSCSHYVNGTAMGHVFLCLPVCSNHCIFCVTTPSPQPFYGFFPGPSGWASARREHLDFMVQGKINRGRYTDHPAGRHSIQTNQCLPPPSPHIFYRSDALPAAQPKASKHWRRLAHSD